MSKLSLEKFMKLSEKDKCKRYKDLSDHDKFLARISQPITTTIISEEELNEEEMKKIQKMKSDTKTLEEMEKFAEKHISKLKEMRALKKK